MPENNTIYSCFFFLFWGEGGVGLEGDMLQKIIKNPSK